MKRLISVMVTITMLLPLFSIVPVHASSGSYREWKQYSGYWKSYKLGGSSYTMKTIGCTTTALAIAAVDLGCENENSFDPGIFLTRMNNAGGYNSDGAIYWNKINKAVPNMSMVGSEIKFSTESNSARIAKISENLNKGYAVLITILRYTDTDGKKHWHYVLADSVNNGVLRVLDPGGANGNITNKYNSAQIMIYSIRVFKNNGKTQQEHEVAIPPETHTCSYSVSTESAHPHNKYNVCNCGKKVYLGKNIISSCKSCYPIGNINLTRSFDKTKGTATFYRNNVSNATSYILKIYKNNNLYNTYNMVSDQCYISGLPSGEYYAVLYAKNTSTGEERSDSCTEFKIADTYTVSFDANGGINAPASQIKIEDVNLTLTSYAPTKSHYIFKGWARSKNATVAEYQPGDAYDRNTKVTLYAVWEPETYTIKFNANGGKGVIEDITITYGDAIRIPNDVICDYSYLKGWSTSKTATTATYKIGMDYKFDVNTTLYAVWGTSTWSGGASESLFGSGTEADPYLIQSESDLGYLANKVNSQTVVPSYEYYKLTNNINLAYNEWVPIGLYGNEYQYFYGSFDGNGYIISDIYLTKENENNIGLFGYVKDSTIKDLTLTGAIDGIISDGALNIGGIAGCADNTEIEKIDVKYFNIGGISSGIDDYSTIGTIAGKTIDGTIKGCTAYDNNITVKAGKFWVGMITGHSRSLIRNCIVESTDGGLFGTFSNTCEFQAGGVCGSLEGSVEQCSVKAPLLSNNIKTTYCASVGGLVSWLNGEAKICSVQFTDVTENSITATAGEHIFVGGLISSSGSKAKIVDCKFDGKSINAYSSETSELGGLIGCASGKTNSFIPVTGGYNLSYADLPKKDGYKGVWYTDAALTSLYDFSKPVTTDITLYVKWEKGDDAPEVWDGTSKEPHYDPSTKTYNVMNGKELAWIAGVSNGNITTGVNLPTDKTFKGYTIKLLNDIYINNVDDWEKWEQNQLSEYNINQWDSISVFSGTLDGNGRYIYGLHYAQLFSQISNSGIVKNLYLSKCYRMVVTEYNYGVIYNCHQNQTFFSYFVNYNETDGIIQKCGNQRSPVINEYGIARINSGFIGDCYNKNNVSGAGITGSNQGSIERCYNVGEVASKYNDIGGICTSNDGTIKNSYNFADIICIGSGIGRRVGGICGSHHGSIRSCYNIGSIICDNPYGWGAICGKTINDFVTLDCCYANNTKLYNSSSVFPNVSYLSNMKNMSNFVGFSADFWDVNSSYNDGYPYLKTLTESYKTYKVTSVDNDDILINRAVVNVDGELSASSSNSNVFVGGIIGLAANDTLRCKNIVENIGEIKGSSSTLRSAYVGSVTGRPSGFSNVENVYYNTDLTLYSSTNSINDKYGVPRSKKTMNTVFYTNILGLTPYVSLKNLEQDEAAVWILKNNQLPELYYNCLNDINISENIENGSIIIDKTQAIDGEVVTVTATPNDGYVLNKVYVDGIEQEGTTFVVDGDDEVYVTFAEEIPTFNVSIITNENASVSLINADAPMLMSARLMSNEADSSITANDGEEIQVNAVADSNYTVDGIYVNGEEVSGNSFILTENSVVTMDITNINTDVVATTNDAEKVGSYFAVVSGSIYGDDENAVKYIRYWSADDVDTVYVTAVESGSGEYSVEITDLEPETTYCYQMTEFGEIKSFTTEEGILPILDESEFDENSGTSQLSITTTTYKTLTSTYKFNIQCSQALTTECLVIACYNNKGKLLAFKQIECDGDTSYTGSVPIDTNIDYAKIFVWGSLDSLNPLAGVEMVDVIN